MSRLSPCLAGLFTTVMLVAPPALADPIVVTAGTLVVFPGTNTVHLEGSRGFTLDALNGFTPPVTEANIECAGGGDTACVPGARISLNAGASDSDLGAQVTLDGQTFFTNAGSGGGASVQFTSSFIVPNFTADRVMVLVPFSFNGSVNPPGGEFTPVTGNGIVRIDLLLARPPEGPRWDLRKLRYGFEAPAAVPEPATLVLVGWGLAGCLLRRRQHAKD